MNRVYGQSIYVEAEQAQFTGDWFVEQRSDGDYAGACLSSLMVSNGNDAALVIPVTNAGFYNVWVRTRDFDTYTGQRLFQVGLDGVLFPFQVGGSGTNGWWWQLAGSNTLAAQTHVITFHDSSLFYPRCDAVFLTTNLATNPNQLAYSQLAVYSLTPQPMPYRNLDSPNGVTVRFNANGDLTNNFRILTGAGSLAYTNLEGGFLRFTPPANSYLASIVLTNAPALGSFTNNLFANLTASLDLRFGSPSESFGIFTRIPSATETNAYLAWVNCDGTGTNNTVRLYGPGSNPQNSTVSGTNLLQSTGSLMSTNTWYSLQLTVNNTGSNGAVFTLNIFNRTSGALLATEMATNVSGALTNAGEIGLRFFSSNGGTNQTLDVNNLSVVENNPVVNTNAPRTTVATLQGGGTRFTFYTQPDLNGATQVVRDTAVWISNAWVTVPFAGGGERLFLEYRTNMTPNVSAAYTTTWSNRVDFEIGGVVYDSANYTQDPLQPATPEVLIPRSCVQINSSTVQETCQSLAGRTATLTWQLGSGGNDASVTASLTADRAGRHSLGFSSFASTARSTATNYFYLLPPLYLYQRLPATPNLMTISETPQPLALVQSPFTNVSQLVTYGVVADPGGMPFVWPTATNATYGFSLLNTDGSVQPAVYSPVLGFTNSLVNTGAVVSATWHVLAMAGDWKAGMEYASSNILAVTDYRQPYLSSLTHALLNEIDLIQDDVNGGWWPAMKGHYQIEAQNAVTQPSPMTYVSLALLTGNQSLYQYRSLPTIEYSLSRPRQHFATATNANNGLYINTASTQITVPSSFDGTAYWQGVHDLLGRLNPWVGTLALTNGNVRADASTLTPVWLEELGEYRLSPSTSLQQQITNDCQTWINGQFLKPVTNQTPVGGFYHYGDYPYWWGLLDLYDTTGNTNYLNYAEQGAFATMAGVFSHPMPPAGNVTANAGGEFFPATTIWWKGPVPYRLGYPRSPGDTPEHSVPAWLVSPTGLTIEAPNTYDNYSANIPGFDMQMMAAWAPQLLRLYHDTGRQIYQTYARNAVIGRFSTDPGYYLMGFTDLFHNTNYPYAGPDVTSFYYHHMQARIAYVIDFLMAQAEIMSNGQINFPWAKQQGYVWFTDRIFGQPGTMYGDSNLRLWFNRNVTQVDTEQVDYLLAHGSSSFWVVLMSQTNAPVTVNLTNDTETLGILASQPVQVYQNNQAMPNVSYSSPMAVTVPAKGLVALRFTTQSHDVFPRAVALTATNISQMLASPWGTLYAFRIRSPFATDSLYAVMTGQPTDSPSATLTLNGSAVQTCTNYPFEFTVYPLPVNQDMNLSLQLVNAGVTNSSTPVLLSGTTNVPTTAYQDWKTSNGLPSNAPDNGTSISGGWPILMEYALNMNPLVAAKPANLTWSTDGAHLMLNYVQWRSDVTYFVQTSFDLINWTTNGVTQAESGGTVTASVPIDANKCRFVRLGVSYP